MAGKTVKELEKELEEIKASMESQLAKVSAKNAELEAKNKAQEEQLKANEQAKAEELATLKKSIIDKELEMQTLHDQITTLQSNPGDKEFLEELKQKLAEKEAESLVYRKKVDELLEASQTGKAVGRPINGTFTAQFLNPKGKKVSGTYGFKDGHKYLFIKSKKMLTEAVISLANGEELDEDTFNANPQLADLTPEEAMDFLTHLVKIQYGHLVKVK